MFMIKSVTTDTCEFSHELPDTEWGLHLQDVYDQKHYD